MKKTILIAIPIIFVLLGLWLWSRSAGERSGAAGDIISRNGLHWHAELEIKILGQTQDIPAGIGLENLPHEPLHTHDRDNIIHLEFDGLVRKDDLKLGKFFQIWGKEFNRDCIFDKCAGPDGRLRMLVNGKENSEFADYLMNDGDKIEIIFEEIETSEFKEIAVSGKEYSFSPSSIEVQAGQKVRLIFQNQGRTLHNLIIDGLGIGAKTIGPGKTDVLEFTAPQTGTYAFFCSIPGHRSAGMEGSLKVK